MSFAKGSAPVTRLTFYYVIGDTSKTNACFIFAHGTGKSDYYFRDNKSFRVPNGMSVNFFQKAGYGLTYRMSHLLQNGAPWSQGSHEERYYGAGSDCPNYILSKAAGRHSGMDSQTITTAMTDYEGLQKIAANLGIVMVTVRNRFFHSGVTLENTIKVVNTKFKNMRYFYCICCRVNDQSEDMGNPLWDAVDGKVT